MKISKDMQIESLLKELKALENLDRSLATSYRENNHLDSAAYHQGKADAFSKVSELLQGKQK